MDVHQHPQSRKRSRNAVLDTNGGDARLTLQTMDVQPVEYDDDDGDGGGKVVDGGSGLVAWQHSSRIYRVSRATGGKDRHSKVLTSKGLRDRRVRLSVSTAIQFYDLQDRLGYDQPSKAVEWLITKASDAISELPSLNTSAFPPTPKQASDEKRPEPEPEQAESDHIHSFMGAAFSNQQLPGSACSSTSETSKGSALSLSRSANRVKARERARERAAKEKEKEAPKESDHGHVFPNQQTINNPSTSFTQLLTGGGANSPTSSPIFALPPQNQNADHLFAKHFRHMSAMDYLGGQQPTVPAFFSNFGNGTTTTTPPPLNGLPLNVCTSSGGGGSDHPDPHLQQFSFASATGAEHHHHHHMQLPAAGGNEYNLNFSISSSLTGYNRGTLQSNAPPSLSHHHHHHHHHQQQQLHKFVSSMDGSPAVPFFVMSPGGTESNQFSAGLDGRLQLYHGDNCSRHSDLKGKGKS